MIWNHPCVWLLRLSPPSFSLVSKTAIGVPVLRYRTIGGTKKMATIANTASSPVNLLDLAASALASTVAASRPIRERSTICSSTDADADSKNARFKGDGSVVTDADFAAQGVIIRMLRSVSTDIEIVGEESEQEMKRHMVETGQEEDHELYQWAQAEVYQRYQESCSTSGEKDLLSLSTVESSRIRVFVDPLDGTKSYANGDYQSVTVLIAIILDNRPVYGVICQPFSLEHDKQQPTILKTGCVAIHGGSLLNGVFVAGGSKIAKPTRPDNSLPRAVISESRSEGLVQDFVSHLAENGILDSDVIHISGAGAKSLRLVLPTQNEALWFFPKEGTSRWDIAASDALLRQLGGTVSDKNGKELDYCKSREDSDNNEGIIASNDAALHVECMRLFQEGKWIERYAA